MNVIWDCSHGPSAEVRTLGLVIPNHARYQTAPHPDISQGKLE